MSVSGRNAPLSPVSLGGSEWSVSKYPDDGPLPNNRGNLASPPLSGGSNGVMSMNGFPSGPRSNGGGPSPPASVGRSSMGTGIFPSRDSARNSTATRNDPLDDVVLQEHYVTLKLFLQGRDPNAAKPPNKARDKLLRLSSVQFFELSTDVFDELIRRQTAARAPPNAPNGPPAFLLPEKTFHPKRNQARQRLSSLGPPRFRDLAADVFHELERRCPQFVGNEIPRGNSAMSMGGPGPGPGPGPRGQSRSRMRQPSDAGSMRGPPPLDAYGVPPSPGMPPNDFGRPMPRQLNQNNTIVPNKSTMVEEDDDVEGDSFGLDRDRASKGSGVTSEADKKLIDDYQSQVRELREKLDSMEDSMKKKDDELESERSKASNADAAQKEWDSLRQDLESRLNDAQNLNESLKDELSKARDDQEEESSQLRDQLAILQQQQQQQQSNSGQADAELEEENRNLRESLMEQRETTEQVRREGQQMLREMKFLSDQSTATYEKQLELERTVEQLENDVREWKNLYARTKTQLRDMRASSTGLQIEQGPGNLIHERGFVDDNGVVKDLHVTKFQIAIDELVQRARQEDPDRVIDAMKSVVVSVRRITRDVDESTSSDDLFAQQKPKLKAKVSSAANHLITASKNFVVGAGLSPVSLLDAAASHLTSSVVELLRSAKIRPTPAEQLDDDDGSATPVESAGFLSPQIPAQAVNGQGNDLPPPPPFQGLGGFRASADSSAYSPINSPRESVEPSSMRGTSGMGYMGGNKGYPPTANGYGMQSEVKAQDYYGL